MDIVEKINLLQKAGLLTGSGVANESEGVFTKFDYLPSFATVAELDQFIVDNQAQVDTHVSDKEAEKTARIDQINTLLTGFDYNGTMISYTADDRRKVVEADSTFEKTKGDGSPLVPEGSSLKLTFDNGSELVINKTDFNATFIPAFYAAASVGLVV